MATFESYTSPAYTGSTKEDLDPKLNLLSQMATPMYSAIGRGTTTNTVPALIERDLAAASFNSHVEGADFVTNTTPNGGTRRSFETQIFTKAYAVSGTEEAQNSVTYEGKRRLAELRAIYGLELKRDFEHAILQNGAALPGSPTVARGLAGAFQQISATVAVEGITGITTGSSLEDAVNDVATLLFDSGGLTYNMGNAFVKNANMLILSPAVKSIFDRRLDAKQSTYRQVTAKFLGVDITKYGSSFGDLMVVPDLHMPAALGLIVNPQNWKWVTLRPTHEQMIAKIGDSERRQLVCEATLINRHTKSTGALRGIAS